MPKLLHNTETTSYCQNYIMISKLLHNVKTISYCKGQNYIIITKAFDSVGRQDLWKILGKVGCPDMIINIIRSFHDGMVGRVIDKSTISDPFPVNNSRKQGCVMATRLFTIVFSATLHDTFKDWDKVPHR